MNLAVYSLAEFSINFVHFVHAVKHHHRLLLTAELNELFDVLLVE